MVLGATGSVILREPMPDKKLVVIRAATSFGGSMSVPGDKSISHRYAMLGAIADGLTKLENFSTGAD